MFFYPESILDTRERSKNDWSAKALVDSELITDQVPRSVK